jgi:hypothetical protein
MALQLSSNFHGIQVPSGYWRVERFVFTSKTQCRAYMELYVSEAASHTIPVRSIDSTVVDFDYDFTSEKSLHTQAYDAAKLMPEFAGAIDI